MDQDTRNFVLAAIWGQVQLGSSEDEAPPFGSPAAREYVTRLLDGVDEPRLREQFDEWAARQLERSLQSQALAKRLEMVWPTPGLEEVLTDQAIFPPWHDADWWKIMNMYPLSPRLVWAIERAEEALRNGQ